MQSHGNMAATGHDRSEAWRPVVRENSMRVAGLLIDLLHGTIMAGDDPRRDRRLGGSTPAGRWTKLPKSRDVPVGRLLAHDGIAAANGLSDDGAVVP